jgi:hypothetical protein
VCLVLLGFNDRYWKYAYPSWVTGKLSDFCGLLVFPLMLWSCAQLAWRRNQPPAWLLDCVLCLTALTFAGIKLSDAAGAQYAALATSWLSALHDASTQIGLPGLFSRRAQHTVDASDLIALPMLLVARKLGRLQQPESKG